VSSSRRRLCSLRARDYEGYTNDDEMSLRCMRQPQGVNLRLVYGDYNPSLDRRSYCEAVEAYTLRSSMPK
jgi:hypothetical protein